ncbi:MAG: antibiotic biosynthesis monooxygenase [Deltaproteobacteria bacterium]|nr:antibiotic biosynthesis monooxygenase [Deltaproteobacteria bacterium]
MRILSIVQIDPLPEKRDEILQILCSIQEPVQAISSCLDCRVCQEERGEGMIVYLEQWQSWEAFMRHLRSETYAKILEAIELSREMPKVTFFEVSTIKGMDLLNAVRSEKACE